MNRRAVFGVWFLRDSLVRAANRAPRTGSGTLIS
jgi:hypothetical protein